MSAAEEKWIYGINAVREALPAGRVSRVLLAKESRAHGVAELADAAKAAGTRIDYAPQAKLNALCGTREHQGVAAAISPVSYASLNQVLEACPRTGRLLVLDQVQHPKNLGLLIRTATGAGTVLRMPVVACKNLPQALRTVREAGFWLYALDARGDMDVFEMPWPERHALVVGNETKGIRPGVRKVCDAGVRIGLDNGLDSLNVAVAAGIALFQARAASETRASSRNAS